jgi:hypothetical protein
MNTDVGCRGSTFTVNLSAPVGFSVSSPTTTVTLKSSSSTYVYAKVTSANTVADGDYPLVATMHRSGTAAGSGSYTSSYKVYSTDTVAPTLYWQSPGDGETVNARSYTFGVSSNDDHAVKNIDLYIDGTLVSTKACDDIAADCQLTYETSVAKGSHTARFTSQDWLGNLATLRSAFTAS